MKRKEMNQKVAEELKHIPRLEGHLQQNLFRSLYNMVRRHDLATNPATAAADSFKRALEQARKTDPDFSPNYDEGLFPE